MLEAFLPSERQIAFPCVRRLMRIFRVHSLLSWLFAGVGTSNVVGGITLVDPFCNDSHSRIYVFDALLLVRLDGGWMAF